MPSSTYSDLSHSASTLTPAGSTRPNSPTACYTSTKEREPSAAPDELRNLQISHHPFPEINASTHPAPPQISRKPDEASLFKLWLVFCDTERQVHAYTYSPNAFQGPETHATYPVVYLLDRQGEMRKETRCNT